MVEKGSSVINSCCENHAERIAAYRLINNHRVLVEDIVSAVSSECSQLCLANSHVLCIQDTTELCYDSHQGRLSLDDKDFGYGTGKSEKFCIFAHPTLVVDADSRMPISYIKFW